MALVERTIIDKIEIVGKFKHVQVRQDNQIVDDGTDEVKVSGQWHRYSLTPSDNISSLAYYDNSFIPLLVSGEVEGLRSGIWTSSDFSTLYYKMTETEHQDISVSLLNNLFSWLMRTNGENELYFRVNKNLYQQGEEVHVVGSHLNNDLKDLSSFSSFILEVFT